MVSEIYNGRNVWKLDGQGKHLFLANDGKWGFSWNKNEDTKVIWKTKGTEECPAFAEGRVVKMA